MKTYGIIIIKRRRQLRKEIDKFDDDKARVRKYKCSSFSFLYHWNKELASELIGTSTEKCPEYL
jgi:hypothetical protein